MNDRAHQVLNLVTENYIRSAKPVPSSLVARQLQVSSATVRNDYGLLEARGYLQQPHVAAGRIPTARAYKRYIKRFIPPKDLTNQGQRFLSERLFNVYGDNLWHQLAAATADLSGYAVMVQLPSADDLRTLHIHLSLLTDSRVLAVVVLETGLIRQLFMKIDPTPSEKDIRQAEKELQALDLPLAQVPHMLENYAHDQEAIGNTYSALARAWPKLSTPKLFSQGLSNLLDEPESLNPDFMRQVVERLSAPDTTTDWDDSLLSPDFDVQLKLEQNTALIKTAIHFGNNQASLIFFGPIRMRYAESLMIAKGARDIIADYHV